MANADRVSARDALHVAIMEVYGVTQIMTFDTGFDRFHHIERVRF